MDFAFYLDLVMIVLLIATIIYAVILNRKLAAFRRSREDMQNFLTAFNAANERAETSIKALKDMAEDSGEKLREDIEKAEALNEDLTFMVDRGESIANRLEKAASDVNAGRRSGSSGGGANISSNSGNGAGKHTAEVSGGMASSGNERSDVIDDRDGVGVETRAEELAARMVRDMERGGRSGGHDQDDAPHMGKPAGGFGNGGTVNAGGGNAGLGNAGSGHAGSGNAGSGHSGSGGASDVYDQDEDAGRSEAERELLAALRSVR